MTDEEVETLRKELVEEELERRRADMGAGPEEQDGLREAIEAGPLLSWGTFRHFVSLGAFEGVTLDEAIEQGIAVSREFVAEYPEAGE